MVTSLLDSVLVQVHIMMELRFPELTCLAGTDEVCMVTNGQLRYCLLSPDSAFHPTHGENELRRNHGQAGDQKRSRRSLPKRGRAR